MLAFIFSNLPFSCFSLRFYHKSFQHQNTNSRAEPKAAISFSFSRAGPWGLYSVSVLGSSYQKQTDPAQCSPPSDPQECPEQQHFCPLRAQKAGYCTSYQTIFRVEVGLGSENVSRVIRALSRKEQPDFLCGEQGLFFSFKGFSSNNTLIKRTSCEKNDILLTFRVCSEFSDRQSTRTHPDDYSRSSITLSFRRFKKCSCERFIFNSLIMSRGSLDFVSKIRKHVFSLPCRPDPASPVSQSVMSFRFKYPAIPSTKACSVRRRRTRVLKVPSAGLPGTMRACSGLCATASERAPHPAEQLIASDAHVWACGLTGGLTMSTRQRRAVRDRPRVGIRPVAAWSR